jgi:hypothetical protein
MQTNDEKPGKRSATQKQSGSQEKEEIKTDLPLSEKDEIKQAEEKLRKAAKKQY